MSKTGYFKSRNILFYGPEKTLLEVVTDFIGHRSSHNASEKQTNRFYITKSYATAYYPVNI